MKKEQNLKFQKSQARKLLAAFLLIPALLLGIFLFRFAVRCCRLIFSGSAIMRMYPENGI